MVSHPRLLPGLSAGLRSPIPLGLFFNKWPLLLSKYETYQQSTFFPKVHTPTPDIKAHGARTVNQGGPILWPPHRDVGAQPPPGLCVGLSRGSDTMGTGIANTPRHLRFCSDLGLGPSLLLWTPGKSPALLQPSTGPQCSPLSTCNPMASPTAPGPGASQLQLWDPASACLSGPGHPAQQPGPLQFPPLQHPCFQDLGEGYDEHCELHRGRGHPRGTLS